MNNRQLISDLEKIFDKDQTKKKTEKEMTKNLSPIKNVIKDYYSKDEVETVLGKVSKVFDIISRKKIRDKDTSPEKYREALKAMYFSDDSIRILKKLLPGYERYFDDVKKIYIKDCSSKPVNYASTIEKIDEILKFLMRPLTLFVEDTDLPALVCYLLKLKNRIKKYNNMVENSNSDKKAEIDTGAKPSPKSSINKKQEKEKEEIDQDPDDDDDLTSSQESSEDSLEEEGWEVVESDSDLTKKLKEIHNEINNVESLEDYAEKLKDLAENAIKIRNATQKEQNLTDFGKVARNFLGKFKTLTSVDTASLDGISTNLYTIAEDIKKLNENSKIEDVRPISNNVAETLKNLGTYSTNKIKSQGYFINERINFVAAATAYLQRLQTAVSVCNQGIIKATTNEISQEINKVKGEPTEAHEYAYNLEKLASIAMSIRAKTQSLEGSSPSVFSSVLGSLFTKFKNTAKDVSQKAEVMAGYDLDSLTGISYSLRGIASNIRNRNYKSFLKDVEGAKALLDKYEKIKMEGKKDELKGVREEFIKKTKSCLEATESALNDRTPEAKLESIVSDFSAKINKIDVKPNQTPDVYAGQLKELAEIAPEIRKATQNLARTPAIVNYVTDSALKICNALSNFNNKDNLLKISDELKNIAEKMSSCDSRDVENVKKLVISYRDKKELDKNAFSDKLQSVRSNFANKAIECLAKVEEFTKTINIFDKMVTKNGEKVSQEEKKVALSYIKNIIEGQISKVNNEKAKQFYEYIKGKFDSNEKLSPQTFIDDVMPPPPTSEKLAEYAKKLLGNMSGDSNFFLRTFAKAANYVASSTSLMNDGQKIRKGIVECFTKIDNINENGVPVRKYRSVLENISDYNNEGFKKEIDNIIGMGKSYSECLEDLRDKLIAIITGFYGCTISGGIEVSEYGDPSKLINTLVYLNLFSNVVSLYNNFNECIKNPLNEYPRRCLSDLLGNNEELENKLKDLETKEKYFDLYNRIMSCKKNLGIKEENYKDRISDKEQAEELIKEIIFPETKGKIPDSEEDFLNAVSNFMNTWMKNIEKAPEKTSGIFEWICSLLESSSSDSEISDSEIIKHKSLCMLEKMIENKGFNNFDKSEYENFKNNYKYLQSLKRI